MLLDRSDLPFIEEYVDNFTGRIPKRSDYDRMLADAREGKFSFVAVENAERFGRNDAEALMAIEELHELGVSVRFADYPERDPVDPDDRILIGLSFSLARRRVVENGAARGGRHAYKGQTRRLHVESARRLYQSKARGESRQTRSWTLHAIGQTTSNTVQGYPQSI